MELIKSGEFYDMHSCLGEELAEDRLIDSNDKTGKWIVGKTYYRVERTLAGGWEIDDPSYIFENIAEALQRFDQLEAIEEPA